MARHTDDVIDLLVDPDSSVRLSTVMHLGEERRHDAAIALVERFGRERDFQIREALTWAVLRVQDSAMPLVRAALVSARWQARLQAAHTLSKLGLAADAEGLLPLVDDPVDCVAARAYWAVARCGDPTVISALAGQLGRGDAEHRNSLLVAISSFDDVVPELVQALARGVTAAIRRQAADTLAYLGTPTAGAAEQTLRLALEDEAEVVRISALNALGQLRTRAARDAIQAATSHPGRVGVLARRLAEDQRFEGPSSPEVPQVTPRPGERVGRRWPTPDLSLVTTSDNPLATRLRPMLAQQVAISSPTYLTRSDVPEATLEAIRRTAHRKALAAGRSQQRAARIAAGRVELFIHEHVFHEQISVADPGRTIDEILYGTEVKILDFVGQKPSADGP